LVEDETYLWTLTRYVHLNPVRARIVGRPTEWPWSSYPGYAHRGRRLEWVAYDELLASWGGAFGGPDPAAAYRRFVTAGLTEPPEAPWSGAYHGWIVGSRAFAERVGALIRGEAPRERELRRESRLARGHSLERVCEAVCSTYAIKRSELGRRGSRHPARAALAYLARRRTAATNAELMTAPGVSRPESVPNLTRRYASWLSSVAAIRRDYQRLERELDNQPSIREVSEKN
jgi:hypothetical protein